MGSLVRMLGIVAILSVAIILIGLFINYYIDVNTTYNNQYKQFMYYGANKGFTRMNGIDLSDGVQTYGSSCVNGSDTCEVDSANFTNLERAYVKYMSMANSANTPVEYKVYLNEDTQEVYISTQIGDVTSTQKIIIGE